MADEAVGTGTEGTGTTDAGTGTFDLGTGAVDTGTTGTGAVDDGTGTGTGTTETDEFSALEALYNTQGTEEEAAAAADPNAAGAMPEEVTRILGLSDYVKEPAHLENAVNAATQLWDVASGKAPAAGLLEGMRASNPAGFEDMIRKDIIPYIEQITGQKLGGTGEQQAPDPVAIMQAKLAELERAPQIAAQQAAQQAQLSKATNDTYSKLNELAKGSYFEGKGNTLGPQLLKQFSAMKLDTDKVMQQVLKGDTSNIEKAFKNIQKEHLAEAQAYNKWFVGQARAKRNGLPASQGNPSGSAAPKDPKNMANWTIQQQAAYFSGK
jgi:hypothetical protein